MEWSKYVDPNILRFKYNKERNKRVDEIITDFKGHYSVDWHEEDGPIEVCVYSPFLGGDYENKLPVLIWVWEWARGKDDEGYDVPIPVRYDFFLGLLRIEKGLTGVSRENAKSLINLENRLKIKKSLLALFKGEILEVSLKKALGNLEKKAS